MRCWWLLCNVFVDFHECVDCNGVAMWRHNHGIDVDRNDIGALLRQRGGRHPGIAITIGAEHGDPRLDPFTLVTAEYHAGGLSGVIGVIGPTRMNYARIIPMVDYTSKLIGQALS